MLNAFFAALPVANGVFAYNLVQRAAVFELNGQPIGDGALFGVVVIGRECGVFHAVDFVAQGIYARVGGHGIFVIGGGEPSENQWHGHHVLDAVVTIGRIVQRTFFVEDAQAGFVGADRQICDVVGGFAAVDRQSNSLKSSS